MIEVVEGIKDRLVALDEGARAAIALDGDHEGRAHHSGLQIDVFVVLVHEVGSELMHVLPGVAEVGGVGGEDLEQVHAFNGVVFVHGAPNGDHVGTVGAGDHAQGRHGAGTAVVLAVEVTPVGRDIEVELGGGVRVFPVALVGQGGHIAEVFRPHHVRGVAPRPP